MRPTTKPTDPPEGGSSCCLSDMSCKSMGRFWSGCSHIMWAPGPKTPHRRFSQSDFRGGRAQGGPRCDRLPTKRLSPSAQAACVQLVHISSGHTIAGRWFSPAPRNWVQSTHVGVTRVVARSVDREQIHHEDQVAERLATFVVALPCSVRLLSRDDQHDLGAEFLSCKSLCPTLDDLL